MSFTTSKIALKGRDGTLTITLGGSGAATAVTTTATATYTPDQAIVDLAGNPALGTASHTGAGTTAHF